MCNGVFYCLELIALSRLVIFDNPRKFCFRLTDVVPRMLAGSKVAKRKIKKSEATALVSVGYVGNDDD